MADTGSDKSNADLDAFFTAASSPNPLDLHQAAQNVADGGSGSHEYDVTDTEFYEDFDDDEEGGYAGGSGLPGQFIAVDPATLGEERGDGAPFVLIPANIPSFLPWWGWLSIGLGLAVMVTGVVLLPGVTLNRIADRLGDSNQANAQYAMRQLVSRGDEKTVDKLFEMASSGDTNTVARLRAVDTLSLIRASHADRALLRLELSNDTDERVREAAIAARKQRDSARARRGR